MSGKTQSIIFLTSENPFPAGEAEVRGERSHERSEIFRRDAHVLHLLAEFAEIEILCYARPSTVLDGNTIPEGVNVTLIRREPVPAWQRWFGPLLSLATSRHKQAMIDALKDRAPQAKTLWVSSLRMAEYIPIARTLGYRVILDGNCIDPNLPIHPARATMLQRTCLKSDAVVVSSEIDACRLQKLAPQIPIHIVPTSINTQVHLGLREAPGSTLLFPANLGLKSHVEGLNWFSAEVLPRLRGALKDRMPQVVVTDSSESPRAWMFPGIEVDSRPERFLDQLSRASVVFFPIRSEGSARFRILEAMAAGRPVVTTGKGSEGLVLAPTYDVCIADQADAFTSAICRLLREQELRSSIARRAIQTVEGRYDWRCSAQLIQKLVLLDEASS